MFKVRWQMSVDMKFDSLDIVKTIQGLGMQILQDQRLGMPSVWLPPNLETSI